MIGEESVILAVSAIPKMARRLTVMRVNKDEELERITSTFGDPVELARQYIVPDCQQVNPADFHEDEAPSVVRTPVFNVIQNFLSGEISIRDGRSQMFILSDAGMGKTSLLKMIRYFHLTKFWPGKLHCELIKLGPEALIEINRISDKRRCILLLDGLDEDLSIQDIEKRLEEILQESLHFHRVIITCRTQLFLDHLSDPMKRRGFVEICKYRCPVVYLSPFDDNKVLQFLEKKYPKRLFDHLLFSENRRLQKSLALVENMRSLRFRPMLLAHIGDLLNSEIEEWSEYSIYSTMIDSWLDRELREKPWDEFDSRPAEKDLLTACKQLALLMFKQRILAVPSAKIYDLLANQPELRYLRLLDVTGHSLLNRNSSGDYRFSHHSIGEYLVVRALIEDSKIRTSVSIELTAQMRSFLESFCADRIARESTYGRAFKANLSGLALQGIRLPNCDLRGFHLENSDLSRANLEGSFLQYAKLQNSKLISARLSARGKSRRIRNHPTA